MLTLKIFFSTLTFWNFLENVVFGFYLEIIVEHEMKENINSKDKWEVLYSVYKIGPMLWVINFK